MALVKVINTKNGTFEVYSITQFNQMKGSLPDYFTYEIKGQKER